MLMFEHIVPQHFLLWMCPCPSPWPCSRSMTPVCRGSKPRSEVTGHWNLDHRTRNMRHGTLDTGHVKSRWRELGWHSPMGRVSGGNTHRWHSLFSDWDPPPATTSSSCITLLDLQTLAHWMWGNLSTHNNYYFLTLMNSHEFECGMWLLWNCIKNGRLQLMGTVKHRYKVA